MNISIKASGIGMTSLRTRERLIERLTEQGISDVRILEAMRDIPRHLFLDEAMASRAYEDMSLPIGHQQTISQPYIVAKMTETLIYHEKINPTPLKKVLEIGSGCGYQTAVLSRFSYEIKSIERIRPLYVKAKKNLDGLNIRNVQLIHGDGLNVLEKDEKFDAILVAAAVPGEIIDGFVSHLEVGGRMVLPVETLGSQKLNVLHKTTKNKVEIFDLGEVLFVPLLIGAVY